VEDHHFVQLLAKLLEPLPFFDVSFGRHRADDELDEDPAIGLLRRVEGVEEASPFVDVPIASRCSNAAEELVNLPA
jgi:hypothetical protein